MKTSCGEYLIVFWITVLLTSCKTVKFKMDIIPKTDQEVIDYAQKHQYHFDQVYRVNDNNTIHNIKNYGMSGAQFVNLYDSHGVLLKKSTTERCEIDFMDYLKDSIKTGNFTKQGGDSCSFDFFFNQKSRLIQRYNTIPKPSYTVVVGWSTIWDKYKVFTKRMEYVNNMIPELKTKNPDVLVIGLSLDPY